MCMLLCMLFSIGTTSCSKDDDPKNSSPIVGTWVYDDSDEKEYDVYTLVFSPDNTGYIRNEYGTRASGSEQMNFDWSLNTNSNGQNILSVIYKSGDKYMDGPFGGGYAQYNRTVTIAGNTLSVSLDSSTVMLFSRK